MILKSIYDLTYDQMVKQFEHWGFKKFKADQLFAWLYKKRVNDFELMSDMSKAQKELLKQNYSIDSIVCATKQESSDGTIKYLFKLNDALVETVLMHYHFGYSICVTSQVGCNMGCSFCASGLLKKQRDLTAGEIVSQVLYAQKDLDKRNEKIKNIVIMGTGEPFDNYDNVLDFCSIVNHGKGLEIGARHITISTCGIVPRIKQFADGNYQYNLAISLHAPNDELRSQIMPINNAYHLDQLMDALHYYGANSTRKITFEYILLKDVNDNYQCAKQLAQLIQGLTAYVNLIPYNAVSENGYQGVDTEKALQFYDWLMKLGVKATLRAKHGDDIDAACGQLRAKNMGVL